MGIKGRRFKVGVRPVTEQRRIVSPAGLRSLADEQMLGHVLGCINEGAKVCMCTPSSIDAEAQIWKEISGTYYSCFKQETRNYLFDRKEFTDYCQIIADVLYDKGIRVYRFTEGESHSEENVASCKTMLPTATLVSEMLITGLNNYAAVV
ncbi:MAG: hypothetical protein ACI4KJ_03590 [Anaerovoracaceae bacterium]